MAKPTDKRPFILFITGVSTAGKTTLYEKLKHDKNLTGIAVHDIDENGIPSVGLTPWRAFRIEELLYAAIHNFKLGNSSIICGVSFPHEIIDSPYYDQAYNIHFLLLEIPYGQFKKRLDARIKQTKDPLPEGLKGGNYHRLLDYTKRLIKNYTMPWPISAMAIFF